MKISTLLNKAQTGELLACVKCPWSPMITEEIAFGVSCIEHGIDWKLGEKPVSMVILQDPADTTPQETGRLCAVHNSLNLLDKTARFDIELWKAAVSLDSASAESGGYLKHHYWTNAIMHGVSKKSRLRKKIEQARKACHDVLSAQIEELLPKVIIAKGETATNSLHEIGLMNLGWEAAKRTFDNGAFKCEIWDWHGNPNKISNCSGIGSLN